MIVNDLIYDVGMHKGEDTEFYLKKGFRVIAIEANPDLCTECERLFPERVQSGQLVIINKAIAEEAGEIEFYINEGRSVWGTADKNWMIRNEKQGFPSRVTIVKAVTISEILREHGMPYYMKIDIEGLDHLCISGLQEVDEKPKFVSIESSATTEGDTFYQLSLLNDLGYTKFKIIPQHSIVNQVCPSPAREGGYIDHSFPGGSSGLFGEELPGKWMGFDQVRKEYSKIYKHTRIVGPHDGLFRGIKNRYVKGVLSRVFWRSVGWFDTHATV